MVGETERNERYSMKKLRPLLLALPLTFAALLSVPSARAQVACNLD
jgi:hypothetical protein